MTGRTLRSPRERLLVFEASGGVCCECGAVITPETMQVDHIIPWNVVRETRLDNLRALCGPCNRAKGARMDGQSYSAVSRFEAMVAHAENRGMYAHQVRAIRTIQRRYVSGEDYTRIIMPVRSGKSDVIALSAFFLREAGFAPACLALTIGDVLAAQLVSEDETRERINRYGWPGLANAGRITQQRQEYDANGEYLLATNQQWIVHNIDHICQWIENKYRRTGMKPVVFIDETHMCSNRNRWGEHIDRLIAAGAHVVMLTGTPWRQGDVLKQWEYEWSSTEAAIRHQVQRIPDDPDHIRVLRLEGVETIGKVRGDYEFPLSESWEQGFLCHVNDVPVDWRVEVNGVETMLSAVSGGQGRLATRKALDDDALITRMAKEVIDCLTLARMQNPAAKAICYGGNDDQNDADANRRLKRIKAAFRKYDASLVVEIATLKSDEQIAETLNRFRGTKKKDYADGYGDIVLLKQAGGTGFNCPAVKVIGDFSTVRSLSSTMQRWFRAGTPWGGFRTFWLVRPADAASTAIYDVFVRGNGGDARAFEGEVTKEWTVEKGEVKEPPQVVIGEDGYAGIGDSYGRNGDEEDLLWAKGFLAAFPQFQAQYTALEVLEMIEQGKALFAEPFPTFRRDRDKEPMPDERKRELDAAIRENLKAVVQAELSLRGGWGNVEYGVLTREAWRLAYHHAGIKPDPNVKKSGSLLASISDLGVLERLHAVSRVMREEGIYCAI